MHTGAAGPTRPARTTISPKRIIVAGMLTALMAGYIGPVRGYLDQRAELRDEQAKLATLEQRRDTLRPFRRRRSLDLGKTAKPEICLRPFFGAIRTTPWQPIFSAIYHHESQRQGRDAFHCVPRIALGNNKWDAVKRVPTTCAPLSQEAV